MTHTVIKAQVEDQSLIITNLPKLASGGFNETRVEFTFSPFWNGLTKMAMFYTDKSRVYYVIIEDNKAVVPHEVMANEGILSFGVFGYTADTVHTTEVVRFTIVEGAITDSTAIHQDPTPDVFQQMIVIAQSVRAEAERMNADLAAGIYTPKRGVDYWTPADKTEIVNDVLAEFIDASEVGL